MRLAVSNLAWPVAQDAVMLDRLRTMGVSGIEVAPTRMAGWDALTPQLLSQYRARIEAAGLTVSSLQAILFGRSDLQLLGEGTPFTDLLDHMRRVAEVAAVLGAGPLVFGSPRNRLRGELDPDLAWSLARDRFRMMGEIVHPAGATVVIEPVPPFYGSDFLTTWSDVDRMVRDVDHPGVRAHLDTGCVALGGGVIEQAIAATSDILAHFHAAQPQLGTFAEPLPGHAAAATALQQVGYGRWVAIEMREQESDPSAALEQAVTTVRQIYGL